MSVFFELQDLSKSFGGVQAVNQCSFSVQQGTITGLIGPNGAGKTTVFNIITGFHYPDSGRVTYKGKDITGLPPHQIFRKGICRTFQIPREFESLTVLENLMVVSPNQIGERILNPYFRPRSVLRQEMAVLDKANDILDFVQLAHLKDEYASNLSGGQKKLLELARTMMASPGLTLLDEPGAGVNRTLLKSLVGYIEKLCKEIGVTFLLIEHDMDLVMHLCNPIIVMSEGTKLMEGPPAQVQKNKEVLDAYLGGQYVAA